MKTLFQALVLISLAGPATAENLYKCDVEGQPKAFSGTTYPHKRTIYVSDDRSITLNLSGVSTRLFLRVDEGTGLLTGSVNDQPGFILRGTPAAGYFESWAAQGTIACDSPRSLDVAFMFRPWKEIFVHGDDSTIMTFSTSSTLDNSCYFGRAKSARETVRQAYNLPEDRVSIKASNGDIEAYFDEKQCLRSVGSYDDYECLEWTEIHPTLHTLQDCDYDPYP